MAFRFDRLCPLRSSRRSDRTLQTGRRRDERGRGPDLCTAAQKPRQTCVGSHESLGEGRDTQRRSFNQSPRHLRVPLAQKGECLARAEAVWSPFRRRFSLRLSSTSSPPSTESLRAPVVDYALCSVGSSTGNRRRYRAHAYKSAFVVSTDENSHSHSLSYAIGGRTSEEKRNRICGCACSPVARVHAFDLLKCHTAT